MEATRNIFRRAAKAGRGFALMALVASLIMGSVSAALAKVIAGNGDPAPADDPVSDCNATVALLHANRLAFNMAEEKTHSLYAGLSGADRKAYQDSIRELREAFGPTLEEIRNAIPDQCKGP